MLHTLRTSPWHADISGMTRLMDDGDDLLLIADGVLAAVENGRFLEILRAAPISIYVLNEDVQARGLCAQISSDVIMVSYTDFVRLTVKHASQIAW
ncbi:sulfurtransferase complex subunit TusB [Kluyvera sichuanensis]|uniref:sulfurtransferase complex subunit TusB n=1 Tax=Kluyvera sichuanensis TaxID=2725494 RepID=UPI0034A4D8C4|nr:sulfurtransferase complex subunit TusB [Gammaproteobacteria bacterium]